MTQNLDLQIPSPVIFEEVGQRVRQGGRLLRQCRASVCQWRRKAEVMRPYLDRQAAMGRLGSRRSARRRSSSESGPPTSGDSTAALHFTFAKADLRLTCYYFSLWDAGFGPAFIKLCANFPYPAKIRVNWQEWAER